MNRLLIIAPLLATQLLAGCVAPPPKPNDPYYAPVLPRTPMPAAQNNGAIYQPGFETNLYNDRKAYRVGDIITITLNERTQASERSAASTVSAAANTPRPSSVSSQPPGPRVSTRPPTTCSRAVIRRAIVVWLHPSASAAVV